MEAGEYYARMSTEYFDETFGEVLTSRSFDRKIRTEAVLRMVNRYIEKPSVIADLGCGPAQYARPLIRQGHKYLGIDITRQMFRHVAAAQESLPAVSFVEGTVENIPLENESMDAALLVGVLEYLPSDDTTLREVYRILKFSGIVILTIPNLLNPVHALRAVTRPLLAPLIRGLMPRSWFSRTVYASPLIYRVLAPTRLVRKAQKLGFKLLDTHSHGYSFYPFNRSLSRIQIQRRLAWEEIGRRYQPNLASNFIVVLRKPWSIKPSCRRSS